MRKSTTQLLLSLFFIACIAGCSKSDIKDEGDSNNQPGAVWVVGYEAKNSSGVATIWKDGKAQRLTDGATDASAASVFVSGNDVYVAGDGSDGTIGVARLWKNGVAQKLETGANTTFANSVFVAGTDVYVTGQEITGMAAWQNYGKMAWRKILPMAQATPSQKRYLLQELTCM
ncbi:hypothetical protein ACQKLP_17615 [Chitinophaga sp. NPDC101104]|uniref:hypothetical protein n=1 Tax=Chitinophaga sp. NPDC101104 TaxID=3390561 RepID=UPI003D07D318